MLFKKRIRGINIETHEEFYGWAHFGDYNKIYTNKNEKGGLWHGILDSGERFCLTRALAKKSQLLVFDVNKMNRVELVNYVNQIIESTEIADKLLKYSGCFIFPIESWALIAAWLYRISVDTYKHIANEFQNAEKRLTELEEEGGYFTMATYELTIHKAFVKQGFFNVPVDFDRYVRSDEGEITIVLLGDKIITGKVNRTANRNGTARIMGSIQLRDWFKNNFKVLDTVYVDFEQPDRICLRKK